MAARYQPMMRHVILLLRDVEAGVDFYGKGVGLRLLRSTPAMAEFSTGGPPLILKAVEGEAQRSTGYSPFLCFDVQDMETTVMRVLERGASLDGAIRYPVYGKVATVRSPDGHMIGLFEPSLEEEEEEKAATTP